MLQICATLKYYDYQYAATENDDASILSSHCLLFSIAYCTVLLWYYHTWWNKDYHFIHWPSFFHRKRCVKGHIGLVHVHAQNHMKHMTGLCSALNLSLRSCPATSISCESQLQRQLEGVQRVHISAKWFFKQLSYSFIAFIFIFIHWNSSKKIIIYRKKICNNLNSNFVHQIRTKYSTK